MKKWFILLLALCLTGGYACAEAPLGAPQSFDLPDDASSGNLSPLPGGGFLLANRVRIGLENEPTALAYQIDSAGNIIWRLKVSTDQQWTYFADGAALDDGSFVLLQYTEMNETEDVGYTLMAVRDGEMLAMEGLETEDSTLHPALFPIAEGYFIFSGDHAQADAHGGTFHASALQFRGNDGTMKWRTVFDKHELTLTGVAAVADGYIFCGKMEVQDSGERDTQGILLKMSADGELLWLTEVPSPRWKAFADVLLLPDGDLIALGNQTLQPTADETYPSEGIIARFSPSGELRWEQAYDLDMPFLALQDILPLEEGFLVMGRNSALNPPVELLLLDAEGALLRHTRIEEGDVLLSFNVRLIEEDGKPCLLWIDEGIGESPATAHIAPIDMDAL